MPDFNLDLSSNITPDTGRAGIIPVNPASQPVDPFETSVARSEEAGANLNGNDLLDSLSRSSKFGGDKMVSFEELDANKRYGIYNPTITDQESYKAENQSGWSRAANAAINFVGKTVAYTLQNTGFILGAPAALLSSDISNMTDNFLVKAGDALKEGVQDSNPIYKTLNYTEGNIWDKLGSSSWWLDDAVDRLALTAAMFVPGIAETKGIGMAALATKGLKALAENPSNFSWLGKTFMPKLFKAATTGALDAGVNPALRAYAQNLTRAELYTWNVVGQSALNAKETQTAIFNATGDAEKAATGGMKSFWETVPVTLASSLIELPQMFATARTAESLLKKFFNPITGEQIIQKEISGLSSAGKLALKAALTGFEHGQNESLQVAISRYNEDAATGKDTRGTIEGIFGDFLDNIHDPNGQNNIALGTIQGILTTLGGAAVSRVRGKGVTETNFIQQINAAKLSRRYVQGDFIERDTTGKVIVDAEGNVKMDQTKLADAGLSLAGIQNAVNQRVTAVQNGDTTALEAINHQSLAGLSYNFFSDPQGMEHLKGVLEMEAKSQKTNADRINDTDGLGGEVTVDAQLSKNLAVVDQLKRAYDAIDQRHAGFMDIKTDTPENGKKTQEFLNDLTHLQYFEAAQQIFLNNKLQSNANELAMLSILDTTQPIESPSNPQEVRANTLIAENVDLKEALDQSKERYKLYINKPLQRATFEAQIKQKDQAENGVVSEGVNDGVNEGVKISIKTKDGLEDLQIGTEYQVLNASKSKEGYNYFEFPSFKIIAENEDGTIRIQSAEGNTKDVPKSFLENYRPGKKSDLEQNSKAKFVADNINRVGYFNFGKGVNQAGRIWYDSKTDTITFVYKDKFGKERSFPLQNKHFSNKYAQTQGYERTQFNFGRTLTKAEQADFQALADAKSQTRKDARIAIIESLVEDTKKAIAEVDYQLQSKYSQLETVIKDLSSLDVKIKAGEFTKKNNFKRTTAAALRAANRLSQLQEVLSTEIQQLEGQKEELQFNLEYFQDLAQNIDELPAEGGEFLKELKGQISDLEDLILSTGNSINLVSKLIDKVQDVYESAIKMVKDLIGKFERTYPKAPTAIAGQEYVDFLKANPNFLKLKENYKADLAQAEKIVAEVDDLQIQPAEKEITDLRKQLEDLQTDLAEVEKQYKAKQVILEKFEEVAKEYRAEQARLKVLQEAKGLVDKVFGTADKGEPTGQPIASTDADEAANKKTINNIASTTSPSGENGFADLNVDHKRANHFLSKIESSPNRSNMRMVMVTKANEVELGLSGLIDRTLKDFPEASRKPQETVVAVYMEQVGENFAFLNKDGEKTDNFNFDDIVFSTMSSAAETNSKGLPRYTGDQALNKSWIEWYKGLRESWLAGNVANYEFSVSQGLANKYEGENQPKNAVTVNLINKSDLSNTGLIQISTNGAVSVNGQARKYPSGRPILVVGNTSVFLNNRNFTDAEAENIFNSFVELSKTITGEKWNPAIVEYLRSVMFFGDPTTGNAKEAGRNQFWVGKDGRLYIGKNDFSADFTEQSLNENKVQLITVLKAAYNNINNSLLQKNEPYNEITGFKDGVPQTRTWKSYQHYLLSDSYDLVESLDTEGLNGKARKIEDVPLTNNLHEFNEDSLTGPFRQKYSTIIPLESEIYQPSVIESYVKAVSSQAEPVVSKDTVTPRGRIVQFTGSAIVDAERTNKDKMLNSFAKRLKRGYQSMSDEQIAKYRNTGELPNFYMEFLAQKVQDGEALKGIEGDVAAANKVELQDYINGTRSTYFAEAPVVPKVAEEKVLESAPTASRIEQLKSSAKNEDTDMSDVEEIPAFLLGRKGSSSSRATRLVNSLEVPRITEDQWTSFQSWMKSNLPQVSSQRVDYLINVLGSDAQAWGVFDTDGIKVYETAEVGTEYHEAFEAVWNLFLTNNQQYALYNEFRKRTGDFTDRATNNKVSFSQASISQAKEVIADEFASYKIDQVAPKGNKIITFIRDLFNFLKNWITKKLGLQYKQQSLFKAINTGIYSQAQSVREFTGAEYSRIPGATDLQTREIIEDVAANVAFTLLGDKNTNGFFYGFDKITANELYTKVKELTLDHIAEYAQALQMKIAEKTSESFIYKRDLRKVVETATLINERWDDIVEINKEFLRSAFRIKITEDVTLDEKENQGRNDYMKNDFLIDTKGNSSSAIKLLFSTLVEADKSGRKVEDTLVPEMARNSYGGAKLLNSSKSFIQVMSRLSNKNTLQEMLGELYVMGRNNPDYVRLYMRLKGNLTDAGTLNYDSMTFDDWRLAMDFYVTFAKQAPKPFIIYTNDLGETYFQAADLNSMVNMQIDNWVSNLRSLAKSGNKYIKREKVGKLNGYNIKVTDPIIYTGADNRAILKNKLIPMLSLLGVTIDTKTLAKMDTADVTRLKEASENFLKYIKVEKQTNIDKDKLGVRGQLSTIADILIRNSDVELKSTYFNIDNEQQQLYVNDNFYSKFSNKFNVAKDIDSFKLENSQYNDIYAANSLLFQKGGDYFHADGKRNATQLSIGYVNGLQSSKRNKGVDKFTESERILTTINSIVNGWYNIIMPSDSATEWMMNMKNHISYSDMSSDAYSKKLKSTFSGYMIDEMNLIVESPDRIVNLNRNKNQNGFRLLKGVLSKSLESKAMNFLKKPRTTEEVSKFVKDNSDKLAEDVQVFIDSESLSLQEVLRKEGKLNESVDGFKLSGLDTNFARKYGFINDKISDESDIVSARLTSDALNKLTQFIAANYAVANTEIHKVIFGDPNNFKSLTDELKRIKSFGSPRKSIYSGEEANTWLNNNRNTAGRVKLSSEDYGYTNFDDDVNTVTIANFEVIGLPALEGNKEYDEVDRSDAQMWAMPTFYREALLKSGLWNPEAEVFFQWDAAKFRSYNASTNKKYAKGYLGSTLQKHDTALLEKPAPDYKANIIKPIVTGGKTGIDYIDTMLDKTSGFPMFFSFFPEDSHMAKLFIKNFQNNTDYAIVPTGRKVGVQSIHPFYNEDGTVNSDQYSTTSKFVFPITNFGIQQETTYHDSEASGVRGTQTTKQVTLNLLQAGVPVDTKLSFEDWHDLSETQKVAASPIYAEIQNNQMLLDELTDAGYSELLQKLSVTDNGNYFEVNSPKKLQETLYDEIARRESNENVLNSVKINPETGDFNIAFEASNNYQMIKNILLSVVDKNVVSPKMNGGSRIQLSSALWDTDKTLKPYIKTKEGWKEVEAFDSLSDKEKDKTRLFSTALKFYSKNEDGSVNPTEILLPHWFGNQMRKTGKTDAEILDYLNNSEDGKKILRGIGFRIPTQEINSMEVFTVKGFLPQAAGDTVVVPAEITKKAGSDFDVDKLNTYLKNIYIDARGNVKLIPYFGTGDMAKAKIKDLIQKVNIESIFNVGKLDIHFAANDLQDEDLNYDEESDKQDKVSLNKRVDLYYKKSLQNAYIESLENLLLNPMNYDRLIKPNDNNGMEKLRDQLNDKLGDELTGNNSKSPLLSLAYINRQRQLSILGKYAVGIGALAQSSHALSQRAPVYIDPKRIVDTYPEDKKFLGDGSILLGHNKIEVDGSIYSTISMVKDKAKQYISDKLSAYINGFVDISKDTFIVELGVTPATAGTFILLERLGVPSDTTVWFMNQPIVREYMKMLTQQNSTFLFNGDNIDTILGKFHAVDVVSESINEKELANNIENYYKNGKTFTQLENSQQVLIFKEFLKYSKISAHLREYMQALTWDTANFSDFTLLNVKQMLMNNVETRNIFNSPENILNNSFIGNLKDKVELSSEALSAYLPLQSGKAQTQIRTVLEPLINPRNNFLSTKEVIKLGNKVTSSFLDYLVQTKFKVSGTSLNNMLQKFLIDSSTDVANKVKKIKDNPLNPLNENYAFQQLRYLISNQEGEVNNVTLKLNNKDVFTQNQFINSLREIKEADKGLYQYLVFGAILQSGTYKSPISFTDLLPLEDYAAIVNPLIKDLEKLGSFSTFGERNLFLRNNWADKDLVPQLQELAFSSKKNKWYNQVEIKPYFYSAQVAYLNSKGISGNDLPIFVPEYLGRKDIITVRKNSNEFTQDQIKQMKAKGDWSYKITAGYEKVKDKDGIPLSITEGDFTKFIYKPINLYGDSQYAQEYYDDVRQSVIDNGTLKVTEQINNQVFFDAFAVKKDNAAQKKLNIKDGKCK